MFRAAIIVASVLLALAAPAGSQDQTTPRIFRSGGELLMLEAAVRDGAGRPITDLQPSEFAVRIDGEPRRVVAARLFGSRPEPVPAGHTPLARFIPNTEAPSGRLVIFAVDRESIRGGSEKAVVQTAAEMLTALSAADAAGVVGLPAGGIEPTRDHEAVAAAIRLLTGTRPPARWPRAMSWTEALAFEQRDARMIAEVVERECRSNEIECPGELGRQSQEMLMSGRGQVRTVLGRLSSVLDRLKAVRAPKRLVLISGGLPFDVGLLPLYRTLAEKAAQARVAIFVVHVAQADFDASDRLRGGSQSGGGEYASGLGSIASSTGGMFVNGVGRATGAMNRIVSEITHFYQLGVESRPADADGRTHRVDVQVSRQGVSVRAPSQVAVASQSSGADGVAGALAQPTDIAELPLEVATYVTHAEEADKVRVIVSATAPEAPGFAPAEWGYTVRRDGAVIGGARGEIPSTPGPFWTASASVVVSPGRYRLRTALTAADGRIATLDLPLNASLRAAGAALASDLIVGSASAGKLEPRARLTQREGGMATIELSSSDSLAGTTGRLELIRAGTAEAAVRLPLALRTRARDATIVVGEVALDLSAVAPGIYTASAVLERGGAPFARVSRIVEVVPGGLDVERAGAESARGAADIPPPSAMAAGGPGKNALDEVLQRVGRYVAAYGEQASLIIATERYEQRYADAPLGEPLRRTLTAELALVKTGDATGWVGFRDVIAVDGRPLPDRQDRLLALFRAGTPDVAEARRIANESARFNLGPTRRNFNEPTATLFFFLPSHQTRFAFTREGTRRVAGATVMEIGFRERARPTMIRTSEGRDVASQGTLWVDPVDGTVLRTRLVVSGFTGMGSSATVDVTFARDTRLGLWLPAKMIERHVGTAGRSPGRLRAAGLHTVTATATYSDFKRFETATSVVIGK
ncbi:MAG: VWA domain-containing protein [Acidobacteriota bacterium]|nr:VWA domain-containing protein [Acidobacteriota bacterium]